jgi:hypothetical protein
MISEHERLTACLQALHAPPFKIEKGVPFPKQTSRPRGRPLVHRWDLLEVGDSVLMATKGAARCAVEWGFRHGRAFLMAKTKTQPFGWRVWRKV